MKFETIEFNVGETGHGDVKVDGKKVENCSGINILARVGEVTKVILYKHASVKGIISGKSGKCELEYEKTFQPLTESDIQKEIELLTAVKEELVKIRTGETE